MDEVASERRWQHLAAVAVSASAVLAVMIVFSITGLFLMNAIHPVLMVMYAIGLGVFTLTQTFDRMLNRVYTVTATFIYYAFGLNYQFEGNETTDS